MIALLPIVQNVDRRLIGAIMILNEILKLMKCFPGSSINSDGYLLLNKQRSGFSVADI